MSKINVICFKWGVIYSATYVNRLYSMVDRNLTLPYRFICITDDPNGLDKRIEHKPLIEDKLAGQFNKLRVFKNSLYDLTGVALTLDLDIVIVDNIDSFFDVEGDFCIEKDYCEENGNNSSVMRFQIGENVDIYNDFVSLDKTSDDFNRINGKRAKYWGDQSWITEKRPNAIHWPSEWIRSYKWECLNYGNCIIPKGCKIVLFHGLPRPHNVKEHIEEYWY